MNNNSKPCGCSFCSQFYFSRSRNHIYKNNKKNNSKKIILDNSIQSETKQHYITENDDTLKINSQIELNKPSQNNLNSEENSFSLMDLDIVTELYINNNNPEEISKKTNMTFSMVNDILKIISFYK